MAAKCLYRWVLIVLLIAANRSGATCWSAFIDGTPLPVLRRVEGCAVALCGDWPRRDALAGISDTLLLFNALGLIFLTAILMLQTDLPLNPASFRGCHGIWR